MGGQLEAFTLYAFILSQIRSSALQEVTLSKKHLSPVIDLLCMAPAAWRPL